MTLTLLLAALGLFCGSPPASKSSPPEKHTECVLEAATISAPLTIDGRLDEDDWQRAPVATGFRQLSPTEGAAPSQRTEVRVLYGEDHLYVGARMYDDRPDLIQARLARRDQNNKADWFFVSIDSYRNGKSAYTFGVNAAGVQLDGIRRQGLDTSWDAVWDSNVDITDEGWVAEMRIPYSMLRFSDADVQRWGIQFRRKIPRNGEVNEWKLIPRTARSSGLVSEYGILAGLRNLKPKRTLQVAPYTLSQLHRYRGETDASITSGSVDVGGDLRVGLGPSVILDATINPDFGQVESDPAVLNLSAFETFFPERRPFFVEGTDVFSFGLGSGGNLVYTRRIGAEAPVVGAMKLTGRTQDKLSFGVLATSTGAAFTPKRHFGAASAKQEIGTYSSAGVVATAFDGPYEGARARSWAGGGSWDLRLQDNTYRLNGYTSVTHRAGTHRDLAPETGFAVSAGAGKIRGPWTFSSNFRLLDDRFNPNDVGRLRRANFFRLGGNVEHKLKGGKSFGAFQHASARLFVGHSWSYRKRLSQGFGLSFHTDWRTQSFQSIRLRSGTDYLFGGYDLYETRGLGPRARPRVFNVNLEFETDSRRTWQLEPEVASTFRSDGGAAYRLRMGSNWSVGSRLTFSGAVSYRQEDNFVEWASNETFVRLDADRWAIGEESVPPEELDDDDLRPLGYGHDRLSALLRTIRSDRPGEYYLPVYGSRDTRRLDVTLRSNVTFTPHLSLEFFGQLFAARGHYDRFRLLTSPDRMAPFEAYPKQHDFATGSFISNAVLRWEFQPGSEIYLVWSQARRYDPETPLFYDAPRASPYATPTAEQLVDTFGAFPEHAFLVKLRYLIMS